MKPKRQLQAEAQQRRNYWNSLTAKDKLASLDERLGENIGAGKQRGILLYEIEQDLKKALKIARAYGAGPATINAIQIRHEARGPAVISADYKGKDKKLRGERGIILNCKKRPFHINDEDPEVLIQ